MYQQTKYALVRIIGNDLVPRVKAGNSLENLKYIVENEYPFDNTEKCFVVNRIVDPEVECRIVEYLEKAGQRYLVLPVDTYSIEAPLEDKYKAIIDINVTRNDVLSFFKNDFDVVLPLDGNCFFRLDGWMRLCSSIEADRGYVAIQVGRCDGRYPDIGSSVVQPWFEQYRHGGRIIQAATEPQIGFISQDYDLEFDETILDLDKSKIDLLFKLGIRGVWDDIFFPDRCKSMLKSTSNFYGKSCQGGWCYRLPSGIPEPKDNQIRAELKNQAIRGLIEHADRIHAY